MIFRACILSMSALVVSGAALADDSSSQPPKSMKQQVHECVKQQMSMDSSLSRADATKSCKLKVKTAQDPTGTNNVGSGSPDKP